MRLIDADAFAEVVEKIKVTMQGHDVVKRTAKLCMLSYIDSAPTIDAAPVVRCGECKMYRFTKGRDMCARNVFMLQGREAGLSAVKSKDWYCADGAKMDLEDNHE
ncbi:MAG: hypothetical protein RSF84_09385 [Ruthenibacterium sp.]